MVLQNGSAISMPWQRDTKAIVESYLAGEAVGTATWNILTGSVNPSGKLAETFPQKLADTPTYGTFNASPVAENYYEDIFVGYRYYDLKKKAVNYPFGHGLSYTTFAYSDLSISLNEDQVLVQVTIKNTGDTEGKEIVQLYVQNLASQVEMPVQELKGFAKVHLKVGESARINLNLNRRKFAWYDVESERWTVDNGQYTIRVGSSSRDIRLEKTITLKLGDEKNKKISRNSLINELVVRKDLQGPLKQSGLDQYFSNMGSDTAGAGDNSGPLRLLELVGIPADKIDTFIKLANQQ